jgi:hypothetical protein
MGFNSCASVILQRGLLVGELFSMACTARLVVIGDVWKEVSRGAGTLSK